MNKQYLRSLQQRAQRLLQISSDQQEGNEQQNFNLTKAKSRRVDLNEVLSNTDMNQLNNQFEDYRNTDVQLLKRCIGLTNQNTELKRQMKSFDIQRAQLKAQNSYLQRQVDNYKVQLMRVRQRQSRRMNGNESPFNKLRQDNIDHFSFIDHNNQQQGLKQKSKSMYRLQASKYNKANNMNNISNNNKQIQRIQAGYMKQISQLQLRLRISNEKKQSMQLLIVRQRQKSRKLWRLINEQIPLLKDIISNITNKVDAHVQSILLKDINQQQMNRKLITNKHKHKLINNNHNNVY